MPFSWLSTSMKQNNHLEISDNDTDKNKLYPLKITSCQTIFLEGSHVVKNYVYIGVVTKSNMCLINKVKLMQISVEEANLVWSWQLWFLPTQIQQPNKSTTIECP